MVLSEMFCTNLRPCVGSRAFDINLQHPLVLAKRVGYPQAAISATHPSLTKGGRWVAVIHDRAPPASLVSLNNLHIDEGGVIVSGLALRYLYRQRRSTDHAQPHAA